MSRRATLVHQPNDDDILRNVDRVLLTHLLAVMVRHGRISPEEVQETFRDTRKRYTKLPGGQSEEGGAAAPIVRLLRDLENDVLHFSAKPAS